MTDLEINEEVSDGAGDANCNENMHDIRYLI